MKEKQRDIRSHADVMVMTRESKVPGDQVLAQEAFILERALMTPEVEGHSRRIHGVVSRSVLQSVPLLPQRRIRMKKGQNERKGYSFHLVVFHRL